MIMDKQILSMLIFREKVMHRYNQIHKYFETGELEELDKFFGGIEPFKFDRKTKTISTSISEEDKLKLEYLINEGVEVLANEK